MDKQEIAMQLTLKALEHGHISFIRPVHPDTKIEQIVERNENAAKEMAAFYNALLESMKG